MSKPIQLSKESVEILTILSDISEQIGIQKGNKQAVMGHSANMYATATLPDSFEHDIYLYKLNNIINILKLFKDDHKIEFDPDTNILSIYNDHSVVRELTAGKGAFQSAVPDLTCVEEDTDITFQLTKETLGNIHSFSKATGTDIVSFSKYENDDKIKVEGYIKYKLKEADLKDERITPEWSIVCDEIDKEAESFKYIFDNNRLKLHPNDYFVRIKQYIGSPTHTTRGENDIKTKNSGRIYSCGEFKSDKISYIMTYHLFSQNQASLRE